jgi:DNA-binding transcriptional MerR regulator
MSERGYQSIGEVLNLLQEEFPDVTISKIRFLESQGLIEPERTNSGYRKFYGPDVERLRFILREQREKYLPLRVIRDRLDAGPEQDSPDDESTADVEPLGDASTDVCDEATAEPEPEAVPVPALLQPPPDIERSEAAVDFDNDPSFSAEELAAAAGVDVAMIHDLDAYGLIAVRPGGRTACYDASAVQIARIAAGFAHHGIEARHLRMYKTAVERETNLFEQVILPLLKQRNPRARAQASEALHELAGHGASLRALLVAHALRLLEP